MFNAINDLSAAPLGPPKAEVRGSNPLRCAIQIPINTGLFLLPTHKVVGPTPANKCRTTQKPAFSLGQFLGRLFTLRPIKSFCGGM